MIILYQIAFVPARNPYQIAVVDPDYQIKGGGGGHSDLQIWGGGHPDPEIRVNPQSPKKNYLAPRVSVWSKNKGGRAPPWIHH